jgi:hypothetical protein
MRTLTSLCLIITITIANSSALFLHKTKNLPTNRQQYEPFEHNVYEDREDDVFHITAYITAEESIKNFEILYNHVSNNYRWRRLNLYLNFYDYFVSKTQLEQICNNFSYENYVVTIADLSVDEEGASVLANLRGDNKILVLENLNASDDVLAKFDLN